MNENIRIEGSRYPNYLNKCDSCEKKMTLGDEYRKTWNEELFEKTGGREGRTYYCDYCWETENLRFLNSLRNYHMSKLNKKLLDNNISASELNSSITAPDMFLTQVGIRDNYQVSEQDLQTFLKDKKRYHNHDFERENKFSLNNLNCFPKSCN